MVSVLIVDDHPTFRAAARKLLETDGFDVVGEAVDGASAIEAARSLKPELVLLDIHLPDGNGLDFARRLADAGEGAQVVLTSSHEAADFGSLIAASGARGFVAKSELSGEAISALLR